MIEELLEKQNILKSTLSKTQLISIHYRSIDNFLQYYDEINSEEIKSDIYKYLEQYYDEIKEKEYNLTKDESDDICQKYIMRIGIYYNTQLNFHVFMQPKWAIFIGLNIDIVLLLIGVLKKIHYIPIATLIFGGYFLYLLIFFGKRNKLFGLRY